MRNPKKPLVLIVGGTKAFDKIIAIKNLIHKTDYVLVGGAVSHNFFKFKGIEVGNSFMEEPFVDKAKGEKIDCVSLAGELLQKYPKKIILPSDLIAADKIKNPERKKTVNLRKNEKLSKDWAFLDIGPETIARYVKIIGKAKTVFWDGPMGRYEDKRFLNGTLKIAEAMSENKKITVLAGGDTASVAEQFDLIFKYKLVSIAGGATLEYLAGKKLPGIEALENK